MFIISYANSFTELNMLHLVFTYNKLHVTFLYLLYQVLTKWGEYSNDVQFILQRSNNSNQRPSPSLGKDSVSPPASPSDQLPERNKDIRKSLTFSGCGRDSKRGDNVGVVRGVPQTLEVKNSTSPEHLVSSHGMVRV